VAGALLVVDGDGGAEEDAVAAGLGPGIDHRHVVEALAEEAHAAIDLAQLALAVDVLGVLRAVSLGGGVGQEADHLGPLLEVQELQLEVSCL
jgi:hypothetical protein